MDMMLLGETILSTTTNSTHHGFWMPAGGNEGVAAFEVFRISTTTNVYEVKLQTKQSDQADSAATSVGSVAFAGTGLVKFDVTNAKDLVRYKIEYLLSSGTANMHVQLCQPLWSPN